MDLMIMNKVVDLLDDGPFIKNVVKRFYQIMGVLSALVLVIGLIVIVKKIMELSAIAILGGLLFIVLYIVGLVMVVQLFYIRANTIGNLPDSDFKIIPIISISFKLAGEVYASFISCVSMGIFLFSLFAGDMTQNIMQTVPGLPSQGMGGGNMAFVGLFILFYGLVIAFAILFFCYFLAEMMIVLVNIAQNMKLTRQMAEKYIPNTNLVHSTNMVLKCAKCGVTVAHGDKFCISCGSAIIH